MNNPEHLRHCQSLYLVSVLVLFLVAGGSAAIAAEGERPPEVRIDHGVIGNHRWSISTNAQSRGASPWRPCLQIRFRDGSPESGSRIRSCGSLHDSSVLLAYSVGAGREEWSVLAMAFRQEAVRARLWFQGRIVRNVPLKLLGPSQASKAGVIQFRFAGLALAGHYCLKRFVIFDVTGSPLERSRDMGCSP